MSDSTQTDAAINAINHSIEIIKSVALKTRNIEYDETLNKTKYYGHSNFEEVNVFGKPVALKEDIDNIIGYIHSSELFHDANDWKKHIRSLPFVPETMAAKKLMHTFLQQKKSLGVVVDEFGGTSGIVALEDIVEEIFGEIEDEHDKANYICCATDDGHYLISARLEIDKVNETLDLDLPESDDYKTVGGLILDRYQNFPKLNEIIIVDEKYEFKIVKNTKTKIELVKLRILEEK